MVLSVGYLGRTVEIDRERGRREREESDESGVTNNSRGDT